MHNYNLIRVKTQPKEGSSRFEAKMFTSPKFKEAFKEKTDIVMLNSVKAIKQTYGENAFYVQGIQYGDIQVIVIDNIYCVEFMLEDEAREMIK